MDICIQTGGIIEELGIDAGFKLIRDAGFDSVDFNIDQWLPYKNIVEGVLNSVFDEPLEALYGHAQPYLDAALKYGVKFNQAHAPFPSYVPDNADMNEYIIMALEKCAAVCHYVNCPYLIVHPAFFGYDKRMEADDEWNANIQLYSRLIPALKKYNVTACLENMFTSRNGKVYEAVCADMNEAAAYIDELNGIAGEKRFAFCFDTGHALLVGKDVYGALLQIGDRVETLHIHDNNGIEDQHIAPYTGKLDWDRFIMGLRAIGYNKALSFETFSVTRHFDRELLPDIIKLIASTGRMFSRRIEAD